MFATPLVPNYDFFVDIILYVSRHIVCLDAYTLCPLKNTVIWDSYQSTSSSLIKIIINNISIYVFK